MPTKRVRMTGRDTIFIHHDKLIYSTTTHMKIAVAGTGYVGLSIATLLAQHHQVTAVDVIPEKVEKINKKQSPIQDEYIEKPKVLQEIL